MVDDALRDKICRFLNLAENDNGKAETDYATVYTYRDGNGGRRQVTLGRGFTEDGGALKKVVTAYLANGGKSGVIEQAANQIGHGTLAVDAGFKKALSAAANEAAMQQAQDSVFDAVYLAPAFAWAESRGFQLPLSMAIAADSFLHSGKMSQHLVNSFEERPPVSGGDERAWMKAYTEARLAWFVRSTGLLKTCQFRPDFFLEQMRADNWAFQCPLNVKTKGSIC